MTSLEIVSIVLILVMFGMLWLFLLTFSSFLESEKKKKLLEINNEKTKNVYQYTKPMTNNKKTYITWFIILVLPPILVRLATMSGNLLLSEELAQLLTIITKIGLIALTIWYASKLKMKTAIAWVLGLSTLIPLMPWISLIILLKSKVKDTEHGLGK